MKLWNYQGNRSTSIFVRRRESFRAIFPRGSRWLGLSRSGCKVAARWRRSLNEICKSGERKETELTYYPSHSAERNTYFSVLPFSSLSSFLQGSIVVVELAVETAIIKYFGRDRNVQNGLRIMDPCIFIDTLKKYHCPFIFT